MRLALISPSIVAKPHAAGKPNRLTKMKQSNRSNAPAHLAQTGPTRMPAASGLKTIPEAGLGKKYVDFWGITWPAPATSTTSETAVGPPACEGGIEPLEVMEQTMGGQDRQARVRNIDEQHEYVVEGGVGRRFGMVEPLLVAKVQRGLIAMMAVGNVQARDAKDLSQFVEPLRAADRPDGVLIAVFARDRQARRLGHRGRDDRTNH